MKDYTYLYRTELGIAEDWPQSWDIFISAFDNSERVTRTYGKVQAQEKYWVVHNEYGLPAGTVPSGAFTSAADSEAEFVREFVDNVLAKHDLSRSRICLDITGFMRPHMMFLVKLLVAEGVKILDVIYTEPKLYSKRERTEFSDKAVTSVRQVTGFEGYIDNDTTNDVLVIGAGYESHLIAEVAEDKEKADRVVIFGLPSLRADMYQQNRLRVNEASDSIGDTATAKFFAPANDPFVAATVLSELIEKRDAKGRITNLYLAPLATKAQAFGFVLFYLNECAGRAASILYPFSAKYSPDTSRGISRVWLFRAEF
jgi:hypothetical protein